jgi:Flp pilus assembly protein TadD
MRASEEKPAAAVVSEKELDVLSELAYRLVRLKRYEEARSIAKGITLLCPDYYFGHALLGALSERCGDKGQARRSYERAVWRNPADAASILNLGRLRITAGEVEAGLDDMRRAWLLARKKDPKVAELAKAVLESYGVPVR